MKEYHKPLATAYITDEDAWLLVRTGRYARIVTYDTDEQGETYQVADELYPATRKVKKRRPKLATIQ